MFEFLPPRKKPGRIGTNRSDSFGTRTRVWKTALPAAAWFEPSWPLSQQNHLKTCVRE
jgi:hypothetical protein